MSPIAHLPPRGYYLASEVGRLAGVSGDKIGQWARRGYIRSSQSEGRPRIYSFQDVAEAMVVHELLERGVRHRDIKQAIKELRERHGDWPLTHAPLATGRGHGATRATVVLEVGSGHVDIGERPWQGVIAVDNLRRIRDDLARGGWAVREVPDLEHVQVDPDRLSGQPTVRGRRIAAEDVAQIADAPGGVQILREDYELTEGQIEDARRWWRAAQRLAA